MNLVNEIIVPNMPFIYRPLSTPNNGELPNNLPFSFGINKETGLVSQIYNNYVSQCLDKAYLEETFISGKMDDFGIGKIYCESFMKFIKSKVCALKGKTVLEIGCGTGYLLKCLNDEGAVTIGIEPGFKEEKNKFNVNIVADFFPTQKVSGTFDIIIAYGVLEHIHNYSSFFLEASKHLSESGSLIIAVPNCEPYLSAGDISMLMHQHYHYFTEETISRTLHANGFFAEEIKMADYGDVLFCASKKLTGGESSFFEKINYESFMVDFKLKLNESVKKLSSIFETANEGSVGIYVPVRLLNLMSLLPVNEIPKNLRFFNDDTKIINTFYPGYNAVNENIAGLINKRPDKLIIASHSFGDVIYNKVKDYIPHTSIYRWEDIFSSTL